MCKSTLDRQPSDFRTPVRFAHDRPIVSQLQRSSHGVSLVNLDLTPTYPMACGRAVDCVPLQLLAFFVFVAGSATPPVAAIHGLSTHAVPAISYRGTTTWSTGLSSSTAATTGVEIVRNEVRVDNTNTAPKTIVATSGGLTFAGPLGIVIAVFICAVIVMAVIYSIYYHHAKLRLHRAHLERSEMNNPPEAREADINLEVAIPAPPPNTETHAVLNRETTRITPQMSSCAVLMSSSAELSPAVYSALQDSDLEPKSPISEDAKIKTMVQEEKALGRREDIMADRHSS